MKFGVSGLSTNKNIRTASASVGVAGLDRNGFADLAATSLRDRDRTLGALVQNSGRLGDRAAQSAWEHGVWFADFTYITSPYYQATSRGGYAQGAGIGWRNGREAVFGAPHRALPLFIDSAGYRRELTRTAPQWALLFDRYLEAVELIDPDGYAAWDYPQDRARSLAALQQLTSIFPGDGRLWPVFSIRWTWDDRAHLDFGHLPGWAGRNLAALVPMTRTQQTVNEKIRERWVRQAIANALVMGADPNFRAMVDAHGKVMIGGMVRSRCPRMARHVFAAVLAELYPGCQFWLLGQANFAVINGLGMMGLLDRIWTDGTWWLQDAVAERMAYVENGMITMLSMQSEKRGADGKREVWRQTFFTLVEMMAANLRSLLSAYAGLWSWPPPEPLPVDMFDVEQVSELKRRYVQAALELGL
ncbi:MAG: hypothetical protein IAE79_05755 [Anaerolinea sp.]|nr:hypothetical protein [Anaerolinea sp.]